MKIVRESLQQLKVILTNPRGIIPFEYYPPLRSFRLTVFKWSPLIGVALHSSGRIRSELLVRMAASRDVRRYEEDPYTDYFISPLPIQMVALDSRFEYDLNRPEEKAIPIDPSDIWGIKLWNFSPTPLQRETSLLKYKEFYEGTHLLMQGLLRDFSRPIIFDVHSFNTRPTRTQWPDFNIGTSNLPVQHRDIADAWISELKKISLLGRSVNVVENEIFKGGFFSKWCAQTEPQVSVLPTEIKKNPSVREIQQQLGNCYAYLGAQFST